MPTPRPVRYRCEIASALALDGRGVAVRARLLEISETGGFVEEVEGLAEVQIDDGATLSMPLPGGENLAAHVRVARIGRARLDVRTRAAEHVSVSVSGFGVEFDAIDDDELERLRDFLELLDCR